MHLQQVDCDYSVVENPANCIENKLYVVLTLSLNGTNKSNHYVYMYLYIMNNELWTYFMANVELKINRALYTMQIITKSFVHSPRA